MSDLQLMYCHLWHKSGYPDDIVDRIWKEALEHVSLPVYFPVVNYALSKVIFSNSWILYKVKNYLALTASDWYDEPSICAMSLEPGGNDEMFSSDLHLWVFLIWQHFRLWKRCTYQWHYPHICYDRHRHPNINIREIIWMGNQLETPPAPTPLRAMPK